jgi:bacterial/archaeal transporter family-2 protein
VFGLGALLVAKQSVRGLADVVREPVWLWTGGALSILIIIGITVGPPRIGLAATIGTIIALNLGVAALIDRFGWFGYERIPLSWARILGLVLFAAGAVLSLRKTG